MEFCSRASAGSGERLCCAGSLPSARRFSPGAIVADAVRREAHRPYKRVDGRVNHRWRSADKGDRIGARAGHAVLPRTASMVPLARAIAGNDRCRSVGAGSSDNASVTATRFGHRSAKSASGSRKNASAIVRNSQRERRRVALKKGCGPRLREGLPAARRCRFHRQL